MFEFIIAFIFFILLTIHIFGEFFENVKIRYITKPFLMPLLIVFYIIGASSGKVNILVILALIFGTIGDVFMMKEEIDKFFLNGMIAFLVGHVFYILFISQIVVNFGDFTNFPWFIIILSLPGIIIGMTSMRKMKPKLGKFLLPTIIYSGFLLIMHFSTLLISSATLDSLFWYIYIGSLLFVISDTILAWNRFVSKIKHHLVYVMSLYGLGQFLITLSFLFFSIT